ncbi:hypothetical protein [Serratia quinivorans]
MALSECHLEFFTAPKVALAWVLVSRSGLVAVGCALPSPSGMV